MPIFSPRIKLFLGFAIALFAMALVFLIYPSFRKKEPESHLLRDDAGGERWRLRYSHFPLLYVMGLPR